MSKADYFKIEEQILSLGLVYRKTEVFKQKDGSVQTIEKLSYFTKDNNIVDNNNRFDDIKAKQIIADKKLELAREQYLYVKSCLLLKKELKNNVLSDNQEIGLLKEYYKLRSYIKKVAFIIGLEHAHDEKYLSTFVTNDGVPTASKALSEDQAEAFDAPKEEEVA